MYCYRLPGREGTIELHFMNCGTMKPRGAGIFAPHLSRVPCACVLLDMDDDLVLVETGLGARDIADTRRLGASNTLLNAQRNPEQPAIEQVRALGLDPADVKSIICTHLDRDHAGGLSDFPWANVHITRAERDAAVDPPSHRERERYRRCHFEHGPRWQVHDRISDERWFGFECMRDLHGLPQQVVLVPLPGHTRGHCGVAVDTGDGWLLHCGDAFYSRTELADDPAPVDIRVFRRVAHQDHAAAMCTLAKLKKLEKEHGAEIRLIASHDPESLERV